MIPSQKDYLPSPRWLVQRYWSVVLILLIWTVTVWLLDISGVAVAIHLLGLTMLTGVILVIMLEIIAWRSRRFAPLESWALALLIVLSAIPGGLLFLVVSYSGVCAILIFLIVGIYCFTILWGCWQNIKNPGLWKNTLSRNWSVKVVPYPTLKKYGKILYDYSNTKEAIKKKKKRSEYYKKYRRNNRVLLFIMTILISFPLFIAVNEASIEIKILSISNTAIIYLAFYITFFWPREMVKKFETQYDFMIFENGLLLPDHSFEPNRSIFIARSEINKIFWNEGYDYILIIFNKRPKYENKLNKEFQVFPKRYIDDPKLCIDIFKRYYDVNRSKILLKENVI